MFYFYDPLMNSVSSPVVPPAITWVMEAPASPLAPPKGWQWAKTGRGDVMKDGHAEMGKEKGFRSPSAPSPTHSGIVAACPELHGITGMPASEPATPGLRLARAQEAPISVPQAALPTWNIVSWKNLGPRSITGTREEAVGLVENDLSMAGIHHLDIQVYDAIHVIVALQR